MTRAHPAPSLAPAHQEGRRISVIIPTRRRPGDLRLCLSALAEQSRPADEVVIVMDEDDGATLLVVRDLAGRLPIRRVSVHGGGVVRALNAGISSARGDILAFTDDDASPRCDWLARLEAHYLRHPRLGGVGGRDAIPGLSDDPVDSRLVGRVQWFGRVLGNHHRGTGRPRSVEFLKGVNMSLARDAIAGLEIGHGLHGGGAQPHWEMQICREVRGRGWRLIYDPSIVVDHRASPRSAGDERELLSAAACGVRAYNETFALLPTMSAGQAIGLLGWGLAVGSPDAPGLARLLVRRGGSARAVRGATWARVRAGLDQRTERARRADVLGAPGRPGGPRRGTHPAAEPGRRW
jgi:hypothetical protein